jgi:hypothetical protein
MIDSAKSLKFKNGKLVKAPLPPWYRKALADDDDFAALLTRAGASNVDEYGEGGDSIQMFRGPNNGYLVIFHDSFEMISLVFIDNVADFMTFKARYIAPLAQLIMASDKHWAWQEDRKKKPS